MSTTYRKLSEIILKNYYAGGVSDDANISQRTVAEMIAMEVAYAAKKNAFENSNAGEVTYASDQFISVYNNLPLLTDSATQEKYVTLPATPVGLPNGQEIAQVSFMAAPSAHIVPMRGHSEFSQGLLPDIKGFYTYTVESNKIVFKRLNGLITGNVRLKLVGAVEGASLLDSNLNVPKDVESDILDRVLAKLMPQHSIKRDVLNDGESN